MIFLLRVRQPLSCGLCQGTARAAGLYGGGGGEAEWVQQSVGLPSRFYLGDGNDTRPVPQGIAGRRAA